VKLAGNPDEVHPLAVILLYVRSIMVSVNSRIDE
jgi:hypothetical protein